MLHPRRRTALLLAVLLAGLVLRVWYATDRERFPDEKYALRNVKSVLQTHSLLPAQVYYPSPVFFVPPAVVLAASDALSDLTGNRTLSIWSRGRMSFTAVLLCRLLQVLYGTASLYLVYLLGRTLFSPRVGLFGAAALAFMPLHIRASAYFKPDAQLVFTVLAAFLLILWALRGDRWVRYLIAGGAIALAMSGKLLGGVVALPLAIGSLWLPATPWRRRWASLMLSAATAAGLFVLLNPHFRFYLTWLRGLQSDYARRAREVEALRSEIPVRFVQSLFSDQLHGPWIGTLALVGLAWLMVAAGRRAGARAQQSGEWLLFLSFPFFFTSVYSLSTPYFKSNNFLSVLPFTAVAAGWAIDRMIAGSRRRWRWWVRGVALPALIVVVVVPGVVFTYRSRTPTTLEVAESFLTRNLQPLLGRLLVVETTSDPVVGWQYRSAPGAGLVAVWEVDDLTQLGMRTVTGSDGFLFQESRLEGDGATFFHDLVRPGRHRYVSLFRPSLFRLRGAALVAVTDRWKDCGHSEVLASTWVESARHYEIRLPDASSDRRAATLSMWIPRRLLARNRFHDRELRIGGRRVRLLWVSRQGQRHLFTSERLWWPASERSAVVIVDRPQGQAAGLEAVVSFWQLREDWAVQSCDPGRSVATPNR